jgi:hypothetical protein
VEFAGIFPVAEVQGCRFDVEEFPEEFTVVVAYWQVQDEILVLLLPFTVAVRVKDCETITSADPGLTVTVTTLAWLPPPHPPENSTAITRSPGRTQEARLRNLIDTSPTL